MLRHLAVNENKTRRLRITLTAKNKFATVSI